MSEGDEKKNIMGRGRAPLPLLTVEYSLVFATVTLTSISLKKQHVNNEGLIFFAVCLSKGCAYSGALEGWIFFLYS